MATLNPGQVATIQNNSRVVRGITVRATVISNAVNTAQVTGNFDPSKVSVKVTAKRNGQERVVMAGNLQTLASASTIGTAGFEFANPSANGTIGITLLAAAVAAAEQRLYPLYIDFGGVLDGSLGEVQCTLQSNGNEYSSANSTSSSIVFDWEEANGTEFFTPEVRVQSVSANESSREYALGSMVRRVVFINFDKTDKLTASQVLDLSAFNSEEFATADSWKELQAKNVKLMSKDDFTNLQQSAILVTSGELAGTDASINMQFQSSNVNGGKNYVVSYGGFVSRSPQRSAEEFQRKASKPYIAR